MSNKEIIELLEDVRETMVLLAETVETVISKLEAEQPVVSETVDRLYGLREEPADPPWDDSKTSHHVSRWKGKQQDGPNCPFYRKPGKDGVEQLLLKSGHEVDISGLLRETIPFGKHKGKCWGDVPIEYLKWLAENANKKRLEEQVKIVLELRK